VQNKIDPLKLDELKHNFLENASSDQVSVTVGQMRLIIQHVLNRGKKSYEERFLQALLDPGAPLQSVDSFEDQTITFDKL